MGKKCIRGILITAIKIVPYFFIFSISLISPSINCLIGDRGEDICWKNLADIYLRLRSQLA